MSPVRYTSAPGFYVNSARVEQIRDFSPNLDRFIDNLGVRKLPYPVRERFRNKRITVIARSLGPNHEHHVRHKKQLDPCMYHFAGRPEF
jgi:hypothetical protein